MGLPYLGCFTDKSNRDMKLLNGNASPDQCFKEARNRGYEFVSMQYGKECFGGNEVGKYGDRPDKECNMDCSKEPGMKCGGNWRNSEWFTGGLSYE